MKLLFESSDIQNIAGQVAAHIRPLLEQANVIPIAVTIDQAAGMLSCSPGHIRALIKRGELQAVNLGVSVRVPVSSLENLTKKGTMITIKACEMPVN